MPISKNVSSYNYAKYRLKSITNRDTIILFELGCCANPIFRNSIIRKILAFDPSTGSKKRIKPPNFFAKNKPP